MNWSELLRRFASLCYGVAVFILAAAMVISVCAFWLDAQQSLGQRLLMWLAMSCASLPFFAASWLLRGLTHPKGDRLPQ